MTNLYIAIIKSTIYK